MDIQLTGVMWLVILLSLGIVNCYFGYRLFMVTVAIMGFLLAGSLGYLIGGWLGSNLIAVMLTLVLGLVGAWASVAAYYAFIFVIGGFGFAFLTAFVLGLYRENSSILFPIIAALIGGFLALWMQRIIITIATAAQGALSSVMVIVALSSGGGVVAYRRHIYRLLDGELTDTGSVWLYLGIFAWLILFVSGLTTQFKYGKEMFRQTKKKKFEPDF